MALAQVSICCHEAWEEGTEKDFMKVPQDMKSIEVGKIYKKKPHVKSMRII